MTLVPSKPLLKAAACLAIMGLSTLPALAIAARPTRPYAVAAVFPPWWDSPRIQAAVAPLGEIAVTGRTGNVVTVMGGDDLSGGLRAAGAWLILDPDLLGCAPRPGVAA